MGVGRPPGRRDSHPGKSSRAWGRARLSVSMATQTNQQHSWGGLRVVAWSHPGGVGSPGRGAAASARTVAGAWKSPGRARSLAGSLHPRR